mgnify:CR=1 FL=1
MVECEFCGQQITGKTYRVTIEGVTLVVCQQCYIKLVKKGGAKQQAISYTTLKIMPRAPSSLGLKPRNIKIRKTPRRTAEFEYDIVEDYASRIKKAREKLGWSTSILAQKIKEKETVIKRIESGKLKPTIELAKKLERILKITLLEPIVSEYITRLSPKENLTLGDIVVLRKKKGG